MNENDFFQEAERPYRSLLPVTDWVPATKKDHWLLFGQWLLATSISSMVFYLILA